MEMLVSLVLLMVGFVLLVKGADWFVEGASGIAARLGIPQLVIGLTIVAMGTSAPEAAVSITASLKGSADITIGNVVGSNIMNVLVILGLAATLSTIAVAKSTMFREIPFMILSTVVLLLLGLDGAITLVDGVILWAMFLVYLGYLFRMAKNGEAEVEEINTQRPLWQAAVWTVVGMVLIITGSNVAVEAATSVARVMGMSERLIGLTIVALGTSLPELFTSVTAAKHGNADIAIGNIVGSNIFNILFVVGTSALVTPIPFAAAFRTDALIAVAAAALLFVCCLHRSRVSRKSGLTLLAGYAAYFMMVL